MAQKRQFLMSDEHRHKIANSNILNALIEHVEGRREMTGSQVTAGVALLKKIMPDVSAIDMQHSGEVAATVTFKTVYERKPD